MNPRLSPHTVSVDDIDPEQIKASKILIIGPTDVGKTTLVRRLYNAWCQKEKVLVLDTDIGQSDIGPPGTLGLGRGKIPVDDLRFLDEVGLHFTGILSPSENMVQFLWGVERLLLLAHEEEPQRFIVDTTGWVKGGEALTLKMAKCNLVNPDLVVLIGEDLGDLNRLITYSIYPVLWVRPSPRAIKRNAGTRRENRYHRVVSYFSRATRARLELGERLVMGRLKGLEDLKGRIVGLLDGAFRTMGVAWVKDVILRVPSLVVLMKPLSYTSIRYIKAGPRFEENDRKATSL